MALAAAFAAQRRRILLDAQKTTNSRPNLTQIRPTRFEKQKTKPQHLRRKLQTDTQVCENWTEWGEGKQTHHGCSSEQVSVCVELNGLWWWIVWSRSQKWLARRERAWKRDPDTIKVHEWERPSAKHDCPFVLRHLPLTYIRSCFVIETLHVM